MIKFLIFDICVLAILFQKIDQYTDYVGFFFKSFVWKPTVKITDGTAKGKMLSNILGHLYHPRELKNNSVHNIQKMLSTELTDAWNLWSRDKLILTFCKRIGSSNQVFFLNKN